MRREAKRTLVQSQKCDRRAKAVASALLSMGMTDRYSTARAELKATRQIVVRFGHAPSVKITLEIRPAAPTPQAVRVLRLGRTAAVQAR